MFCVHSWVWHEIPEEGQRTYRTKLWEYNKEDEDGSSNIQSDKDYQASSQKFRQIKLRFWRKMQLVIESISSKTWIH